MYIVFITPFSHIIHNIEGKNHSITCIETPLNCTSVQIYSSIMDIRKRYNLDPKDALEIIREGYLNVGV